MGVRANCIALLLSGLPVAGCGTVKNTVLTPPYQGGKVPFGGVRQDRLSIQQAASGQPGPLAHPKPGSDPNAQPEQAPRVARMLLFAADLPFSFIGDLVTYPYTLSYSFINQPVVNPPVVFANGPGALPYSPGALSIPPGAYPGAPATLPIPPMTPPNPPGGALNPPALLPNPAPVPNPPGAVPNPPAKLPNPTGIVPNLPAKLPNPTGTVSIPSVP